MDDQWYNKKEAIIFSQRIAQLSKALWKAIEKDWQEWIKPYDLNINEHHILWISHQLKGASISDIAKFGVMHVSTAFNFSKKLEQRGLLEFSKKESDKRNTYVQLTDKGEQMLLELMESYNPKEKLVFKGALPIKNLYGHFPDLIDLMTIVKHIYGDHFIKIFEHSFSHTESTYGELDEKRKKLTVEKSNM